jgi:hypothetical protein
MNLIYGTLVLLSYMGPEATFYGCKPQGKLVSMMEERDGTYAYTVKLDGCVTDTPSYIQKVIARKDKGPIRIVKLLPLQFRVEL